MQVDMVRLSSGAGKTHGISFIEFFFITYGFGIKL